MRKSTLICLSLIVTVILFLSFSRSKEKSSGNLGDVKYSVLAEKEFIDENGEGWILLDDKAQEKLRGSDLARLRGTTALPDGRGVFIRGVNFDRDTKTGDPDSADRKPLSPQGDAFQGHYHEFDDQVVIVRDGAGGNQTYLTISRQATNGFKEKARDVFKKQNYITNAKTDGENNQPRISNETRPKNISLFTYIKINN